MFLLFNFKNVYLTNNAQSKFLLFFCSCICIWEKNGKHFKTRNALNKFCKLHAKASQKFLPFSYSALFSSNWKKSCYGMFSLATVTFGVLKILHYLLQYFCTWIVSQVLKNLWKRKWLESVTLFLIKQTLQVKNI